MYSLRLLVSNLTSKIENLKFGAQKESLLLAQKAFWGGAGLYTVVLIVAIDFNYFAGAG